MKVDVYSWEDNKYRTHQALFINGSWVDDVCDLCETPEDAIIGRDLKDCNDLAYYLKKGYEAAKNGEELEIEYHEVDSAPQED